MIILGIETSSKIASVAVCDGTNALYAVQQNAGRTHSTILQPLIEETIRNAGVKFSDLDGIAVGVGPGSYTGIRIGIAAAKGIAFASGLPVCGVSSLEALAVGALLAPNVIAVRYARNNLCYAAVFSRGKRVLDDIVIDTDELTELLFEMYSPADFAKNSILFTGDYADVMQEKCGGGKTAPENLRNENAAFVCTAAMNKPFYDGGLLRAAYLERTKAEKDRGIF
jgi:tRNA threonylcarbamoyladenosine biosynthesis protein TsaB